MVALSETSFLHSGHFIIDIFKDMDLVCSGYLEVFLPEIITTARREIG